MEWNAAHAKLSHMYQIWVGVKAVAGSPGGELVTTVLWHYIGKKHF